MQGGEQAFAITSDYSKDGHIRGLHLGKQRCKLLAEQRQALRRKGADMAVFGAEVFAGLTVGTLYTGALSHGQHGFWTVTAVGKSEVTLRKVNKGTDGITGGRMVTLSESEYDGLCKTWNEKRNGKVTLGMHHIIISKDKETAKEQRRMVAAAKRIAAKENIG